MPKLLNAVRVNCSTTGTGATLAIGSAVSTAYQTPGAAGAVAGDVYTITIDDGAQREITVGTVGAGATSIDRAATPIWSSTGARLNLSGSAIISFGPAAADLLNPDLFGIPGAPPTGLVRLGVEPVAGCEMPAFANKSGAPHVAMPMLGKGRVAALLGLNSGMASFGELANFSGVSGASGALPGASNYASRNLMGYYSSTATAGTIGYGYPTTTFLRWTLGTGGGLGGFLFLARFGMQQAVAGARTFIGMTSNSSAPTNVAPPILTNTVGLAQIDGSSNLNLIWAGSSSMVARSATPLDLGANFPANTGGSDLYEVALYSDPFDASYIGYTVKRYTSSSSPAFTTSGTIANTVPGTTLPAATTFLGPTWWRTNNATATTAGMFVPSLYLYTE